MVCGVIGGVLAAQKLLGSSRMPNARVWQRILSANCGEVDAAIFIARVQARYFELKSRRPVFNKLVLNFHITGNLLPGLALYQVFCEDGMTNEEAIAEIERLFKDWFDQVPPLNLRLNQLMAYTPESFNGFRRLVCFTIDTFFPPPGWQYEMVVENENTFALNIHHCFYLKILEYYGAPELTPVFCKLDDYLMAAMPPSILWGRTQTIGLGADFCNFRWDYVPFDKVQPG